MNITDFDLLEGGGVWLRYYFEQYFAKYNLKYSKGAEMCAGKGLIGFYLLEHGFFETMDFIEVNPIAIPILHETIKKKGLEDRCNVYLSDGFDNPDIPTDYDCIVGNPPWYSSEVYFHSDTAHYFVDSDGSIGRRLSPELGYMDRDWAFHKRMIKEIPTYTKTLTFVESSFASAPVLWERMLDGNQRITRVFNDKHNLPAHTMAKFNIPHYSYIFSIDIDESYRNGGLGPKDQFGRPGSVWTHQS